MSKNKTLFISESKLKDNSVLMENVDMKLVTPSIQYVQDNVIQRLCGTKLYRELQSQVYNNALKTDYKELLDDYIEPILIYGVLAEIPSDLLLKMMNLTVGSTQDDQVTSATLKQVHYLKEQNKNKMQFYAKRMVDHLSWNSNKFPEFLENTEDDMHPTYRAYTSNIAMGSTYNGRVKGQLRYGDVAYDLLNKIMR